jgi:thioredoxin 1
MAQVLNLNEADFDSAIQSDKPILVDFWAEWCNPCKMIAPILDQLADEMGEDVTIAKVNVEDNTALAQRFGISSIPNLKVFKNGVEIDNIIGAAPKARLKDTLEKHI